MSEGPLTVLALFVLLLVLSALPAWAVGDEEEREPVRRDARPAVEPGAVERQVNGSGEAERWRRWLWLREPSQPAPVAVKAVFVVLAVEARVATLAWSQAPSNTTDHRWDAPTFRHRRHRR